MNNSARIIGIGICLGALALGSSSGPAGAEVRKHSDKAFYANSLLGSYLAGKIARVSRDNEAAARFYGKALSRDPGNNVLLRQAFVLEASMGNWSRALPLARKVIKKDKKQRLAQMALGAKAFTRGHYTTASKHFSRSQRSPIAQLTSTLAEAWILQAQGKTDEAFKKLEKLDKLGWAKFYQRYHHALIADVSGRRKIAREKYKALFNRDPRTLRVTLAYARHLAKYGDKAQAIKVLKKHLSKTAGHPLPKALMKKIETGYRPALFIGSSRDGLAEIFYGIGDALTSEGGIDVGTIYLQIAILVKPDFPMAYLALGEVYEDTKRFELSNSIYDKISKSSPLLTNVIIRKAFNLNALKKVDESQKILDEIIARRPTALRPLEVAGNIMRAHKRYDEARSYYDRAIALIKKPEKKHWKYYYSRGVCFERLKQWGKAEADLLKANELNPNQPLVLNYLGYSWVDQNLNLDRAMGMIKKAVKLKPEDGYFVDSLGWAYFRLGNFKEATRNLERAVELRSEDPVINGHLGDAYWRVGRRFEAKFQWRQALSLDPDPGDATKFKKRLQSGLIELKKKKYAVVPQTGGAMSDAVKTGVDSMTDGNSKMPEKSKIHQVETGESLWDIAVKYFGDGNQFKQILRANPDLLKSEKDLRPGMKIKIPSLP